jgi:hypothetical protein
MSILARHNNTLRTVLLSLLLLPALLHAEQENRWYQVEIIVFSQNNPEYHESELWPVDYSLPDLTQSRELASPAPTDASQPVPALPQPFSLVAADRLQLGETAQRIRNASDVELVLHLGWLQPGLSEEQAVAVHIYEGMPQTTGSAVNSTLPAPGEPASTAATLPKLDGTLRLILSRYLHLAGDLVWREPLPAGMTGFAAEQMPMSEGGELANAQPETTAANGNAVAMNGETGEMSAGNEAMPADTADIDLLKYRVFRLQQSRRMRSSEIHYLDHPLFGVIAQVTPYELPQPKEIAAATPKP